MRYGIFKRHRVQAHELFASLSSSRLTALAMSYQRLWDHWQQTGERHIEQLRQRYDVPLTDIADQRATAGRFSA